MSQDKNQIRQRMLALRRQLSHESVAAKGKVIARRLRGFSCWRNAAVLLAYVNVANGRDNEVPTRPLIAEAIASGRQVLVPIALRGGTMAWSRLESLDELAISRFGVPEPPPGLRRLTEPPRDALCLTPGIAFTPDGYRIGYGGGYYDRFLANFDGISVGLAFEEQLLEDFPRSAYDIPVQSVITDTAVYGALAGKHP